VTGSGRRTHRATADNGGMDRAVDWDSGAIVAVDQTVLPAELRHLRLTTVDEVVDAIRRLVVRGAPVIGVTGAFGVAIAARQHEEPGGRLDQAAVRRDAQRIADSRPTAVNLRWAVERVLTRLPDGADAVLAEAHAVLAEDERANRTAARRAADVLREECPDRPLRVLTHCNSGALATMGGGTAFGAIRELARDGRLEEAIATETRPLLQGARLTVWELHQAGLPHRLCVDSAAAAAMAAGLVDAVVVGADRIAANGDTANKIGTYGVAVLAREHNIPFYVAAPLSTIDLNTPDGDHIPIEERNQREVTHVGGAQLAPAGALIWNPSFDVTPHKFIAGIITERGIFRAPYTESLKNVRM
jgi:methylthioribose-1-phosphate isomerase